MSVIPMARCVGSIRQISAGHGFCHFSNFNYWKAACYKTIVRVLFMMRLPKPISNGLVTIHAYKPLAVENLITVNAEENREYAIFGDFMA